MVYTVFYKTSSFAGYCFLNKNSIHPKRCDVFNFKHFEVTLVKFQICSFIVLYFNFLFLLYQDFSNNQFRISIKFIRKTYLYH